VVTGLSFSRESKKKGGEEERIALINKTDGRSWLELCYHGESNEITTKRSRKKKWSGTARIWAPENAWLGGTWTPGIGEGKDANDTRPGLGRSHIMESSLLIGVHLPN